MNAEYLPACSSFVSTMKSNSTLLEVGIDFFNQKNLEVLNKTQAQYISNHSPATHLIKINQTIVAGDLALVPLVFDLKNKHS